MQGAFLIIFTLFWSAFVLTFDGFMIHNLFKQAAAADYLSVTGKVTYSEVRIHHGSKGGISYEPVVDYRYEVSGQSFAGNRIRYNSVSSSSQAAAYSLVDEHPAGSTLPVFYNRENPQDAVLFTRLEGSDFVPIIFLTPFNAVMVGLFFWTWSWLRERFFRPAAGGVEIITDGMYTRVRLPQVGAVVWWLAATGGFGFAATFILGFSTAMRPSIPQAFLTIAVVYVGGAGVYLWQWMKIRSGIDDLVINDANRSLELPLTFDRKERMTVSSSDIEALTVDQIEHRSSKGGVSFTYAPTLRLRSTESAGEKLADWGDKLKADDFAAWLRQKLGL